MALTLYYNAGSFYSQRGRFALEEKGMRYRHHIISIHSGEAIEPWYIRIQPNGTVPTLKHGDVIKTDSKDIIAYMDEITPDAPKFFPDPSTPGADRVAHLTAQMEKIRVENISYGSICYRQHTHECRVPDTFNVKYSKRTWDGVAAEIRKLADQNADLREVYLAKLKVLQARDLTDEQLFLDSMKECEPILDEVEEQLAQQWKGKFDNFSDSDPWLCCNHFTVADIYLATLLHRFTFVGQAKRFFGDGKRPYLAAYYVRVQRRKSFQRACGSANNLLTASVLPKLRHQIRKALPRLVGYTLVAELLAVAGFAIYVKYQGFPSWWPNGLKLNL